MENNRFIVRSAYISVLSTLLYFIFPMQHSCCSALLQEIDRRPLDADSFLEAMMNNRRYIVGNNLHYLFACLLMYTFIYINESFLLYDR